MEKIILLALTALMILLAFTALIMAGCDVKQPNTNTEASENIRRLGYEVIVVDNCEYIRGNKKLAHKGNCRFCKERRQKELEELVIKLKEK